MFVTNNARHMKTQGKATVFGILLGVAAQMLCASVSLAEDGMPLGTLGPHYLPVRSSIFDTTRSEYAVGKHYNIPRDYIQFTKKDSNGDFSLVSMEAASIPANFQEPQFYGCWKHAGVRPVANQWTGYSIMCFRNNRTVYYSYVSPEHGRDDLFEWQFIQNDILSIDEQSCSILPGTNAEHMFLARCLYMGAWVRQCARMNNEGTGCPARDQ
jgi:hypothetical protein